MNVIWIGLGGFAGAILRHWVSGAIQRLTHSFNFPFGTLAVNILGCLAIGMLSALTHNRDWFSIEQRAFVFVGLLGAFTTFSTFGNDTRNLVVMENLSGALWNVGLHIVLGLGAVWLGYKLGGGNI